MNGLSQVPLLCYLGCTSVVSHTRKPLCTLSDVAEVTVSSSSSRKSSPRWQFWRRSQPPSVMLLANSLRAWTSWPCPMEMGRHGAPCRQRTGLWCSSVHPSAFMLTSNHFQPTHPSQHLSMIFLYLRLVVCFHHFFLHKDVQVYFKAAVQSELIRWVKRKIRRKCKWAVKNTFKKRAKIKFTSLVFHIIDALNQILTCFFKNHW